MAGLTMHQHITRVEHEEGKSFLSVLEELAKSGESKSGAAAILDIPQTTLCGWLRKGKMKASHLYAAIEWPAKNACNGFYSNVQTRTPARLAASRRNIGLAMAACRANKP